MGIVIRRKIRIKVRRATCGRWQAKRIHNPHESEHEMRVRVRAQLRAHGLPVKSLTIKVHEVCA